MNGPFRTLPRRGAISRARTLALCFLAALPVSAQQHRLAHRARMDIEALDSVAGGQQLEMGMLLEGYGSLGRFSWGEFTGAESARTWMFEWNVHRHGWTRGSIRFVPARSGGLLLRLRGPWVPDEAKPGSIQRAEVLFDSVEVTGAHLSNGGFEISDGAGRAVNWLTPGQPAVFEESLSREGVRSARVWHDGYHEQVLAVTAGQLVTVSAWARSWAGPELAGEVGDAGTGRFDLYSETVALDALCLESRGDVLYRATWVDDSPDIWGRTELSWAGEFGIGPWFWTPFDVRFVPRTSGEVRLHLRGPWAMNPAGRVRVQSVEWDGLEVTGAGPVDGSFEGPLPPAGWRDPQPGATAAVVANARVGLRTLVTWHDGGMESRLAVVARREVRIRGWARSSRPVEETIPTRLEGENSPAHQAVRMFQRGVNLGNFLEERPDSLIRREFGPGDFEQIAAEGFDHVRIPVAWHHHPKAGLTSFDVAPDFLARVDAVLDQVAAAGLAAIVNWHHFEDLMRDPVAHETMFVQGWDQLGAHFASRPAAVALELLNEPHGMLGGEQLNTLLGAALEAVRARDPDRTVFVGPGGFQSIDQLPLLRLPEGESNVVVTVHCYEPFLFTHQGADWTGGLTPVKGIHFPGHPGSLPLLPLALPDWVRQWMEAYASMSAECHPGSSKAFRPLLAFAGEWARATGRPVHVGEFGVYRSFLPPGDSAMRYLAGMRRALAEAELPWSLWEWKAGFGYWDPAAARPHPGAVAGIWGRPEIRRQPAQAVVVDPGSELTLSVEAVSDPGDGVLRYAWLRDHEPVAGANGPELRVSPSGDGQYRVRVSNAMGVTFSAASRVTIHTPPLPVKLTAVRSRDAVHLRWLAEHGQSYRILRATNLAGPWVQVATVIGDGGLRVEGLPADEKGARWFRLATE
ncbi:MAG: glycoside hydrolase family 5 protein [Verrucomicrobiae bacterium]|nr:glycoside hydrolase family 5 protein [Verrucomicrobiae bacterium]